MPSTAAFFPDMFAFSLAVLPGALLLGERGAQRPPPPTGISWRHFSYNLGLNEDQFSPAHVFGQ
jgi:hypothetical protein